MQLSGTAQSPGADALVEPPRLSSALDAMGTLPVLKGTVRRVMDLADDPEVPIADLTAAIEEDESFAANMLAFANSAANARPIRARTIRQAVTLVGRRATRRLALEAVTYSFLEHAPGNGSASRGQMHLHAIEVSHAATRVAEMADLPVDAPHLAGLLHDVGKLLLPRAAGELVMERIALQHPAGAARAAAERRDVGFDHALAGALLARRWGCTDEVVEAIAWHHDPPPVDTPSARSAACVYLADRMAAVARGETIDQAEAERVLVRLHASLPELADLAETVLCEAPAAPDDVSGRVARLEELARTDDLTGLSNRRHWMQTTRADVHDGRAGCVLLCDVDDFKSINDRLGHRIGDLVLAEVGRVLGSHGRAGRIGGDEFAIWVDGGVDTAIAHAQAILAECATALRESADGRMLSTISIGITSARADGGVSDILEEADTALYRAKELGGNRAVLAESAVGG